MSPDFQNHEDTEKLFNEAYRELNEGLFDTAKRAVDSATVFRFVKLLATPFTKWPAYKTGVIDADGNTLKKRRDRKTSEEKGSFTMFHRLVRNIKRIVGKVPFGKTVLANFAAALFLIREYKENPRGENLHERFEEFWRENKEFINETYYIYNDQLLSEETTTAAVQGYDAPMAKIDRRDNRDLFMGAKVFDVDTGRFMRSRYGKKKYSKYERFVGSDELGEDIRSYGRTNPKKGIILRDSVTGAMIWLKRPRK